MTAQEIFDRASRGRGVILRGDPLVLSKLRKHLSYKRAQGGDELSHLMFKLDGGALRVINLNSVEGPLEEIFQ